jgi:ABC-type multidrug transport system fused ATPase/permease subunit
LHLLCHFDTFNRVCFYSVRLIHECDALGGVAYVEADTDAVILVGSSNSELNLVSILISMFFVTLDYMAELAWSLVIFHLLSVPRGVTLFSALLHIVV